MNRNSTTLLGPKIVIALICAMGFLLSLCFIPGIGGYKNRILSYSFDLFHYPLFAAITAVLLLVRRKKRVKVNVVLTLTIVIIINLIVEGLQPFVDRTASIYDILLGLAGSISVLCVYLAMSAYSSRMRWFLYMLSGISFSCAFLPLGLIALDAYWGKKSFPVIDSFEQPVNLGRWLPEGCLMDRTKEHVTHGRYALKISVDKSGSSYPGIFYADGTMDWSDFRRFALDIFLEAEKSRYVWIRADDRSGAPYEDRSQVVMELKPGPNTIWVDLSTFSKTPSGRMLDISHIETFGIFLEAIEPGEVVYLDRIALSSSKPCAKELSP